MAKKRYPSKKQYLITGLIIIFAATAFLIYLLKSEKSPSISQNEVLLILDFGKNSEMRKFRTALASEKEMKAWSLLQQATAFANIILETENNFVPKKINGLVNSDDKNGKKWQMYLNGEKQEFKPFNILVKGGDEVVFKYE